MEVLVNRVMQTRSPSVLVVGDVMYDVYLRGRINRISPEAPVPILDCVDRRDFLGGAANVALNLKSLGCEVRLLGVVGKDDAGYRLRELLKQYDVSDRWLLEDEIRPTTEKTRIVADQQQIIRLDKETRISLSASLRLRALDMARALLEEVDGLLCSDYQKGVISTDFIEPLFAMAGAAGRPIIVDPKLSDFSCYQGATVLTPNLKEVEQASGIAQTGPEALEQAATLLLRQSQAEALLVTRGKDGMSMFQPSKLPLHIPTQAQEVFDVSGAGDTVVATFTMGRLCGLSMEDAAHLANVAAGVVVGKLGTAIVSLSDLKTSLPNGQKPGEHKIKPSNELERALQFHRDRGDRIIFASGCFDLLHVGHIHLLQEARSLGEVLVVALNDDASVHTIKGAGRPLISQQDRARILAALTYVDYVTVYSEPKPISLLKLLKPDILVQGEDPSSETVLGRDEVESFGGSIHIVKFASEVSTTTTIKSIAERFR